MVIRPATAGDRAVVTDLLAAQFREHDIPLAQQALAAGVDGVLDDPARGVVLLALVEGEPVAIAYLAWTWTLEHGGRVGWLEELYARPDHRGRGVGTALLAEVCRWAGEAGCRAVDLEVEAGHARALRLYERGGFRRLDRARLTLRLA